MPKRTLAAAVFLSVFFVFRIQAANVSFLVIETGLSFEAGANQHSELWESGLFDVFFEAGHIASNAPVLRIEANPKGEFPQEALDDLKEATDGGAEYFIIVLLDYDASQSPQAISLQLFRIDPYEKIFEQHYTGRAFSSTREEYDNLKVVIQGVVPYLNNR